MDIEKPENHENQSEIFLNETSRKRPRDVVDVIGGHGPWQFRQWIVFFAASLCNSMMLFSALFLPVQTFCSHTNTTVPRTDHVAVLKLNETQLSPVDENYVENNQSEIINSCNLTDCSEKDSVGGLDISSSKLMQESLCWNSQTDTLVKSVYVIAGFLSGLIVYFTTKRFGRRNVALVSCLFLVVASGAGIFTYIVAVFVILRFIAAVGVLNIYLISAFSLMEYVHKDYKILYFLTGHLGWGIAHFLLPAVAWLGDSWTSFHLILTVVCIFLSLLVWWGPESPSSNGSQLTRSKKALKYAAFTNGYSTSDVDMLSHNYHLQQEKEDDMGISTSKKKLFFVLYSSLLFIITFTTAFLYFAAKWHSKWFGVESGKISFSFLGSTEVAASIILLFLSCFISIKYLWGCVSALASATVLVSYARNTKDFTTSLAILYTLAVFFAASAWTLLLTKSFCHKITSTMSKLNLVVVGLALIIGALAASGSILTENNRDLLLAWGVLNLIVSVLMLLLPAYYFGP